MAQKKEIISTLNDLIQTLKDGQEGFQQAATGVDDTQLKSTFVQFSTQRAKFAGELQTEVVNLGDADPEDSGSVTGAAHRTWTSIKGAVTNRDSHAILAEAERGEDSAVAAYKDALQKDLPAPIKDIVSRQQTEVKAAHDKVRSLRDAAAQK
ncbi:MAG TPA: PA2169 family four-helix-bundle protein [Chthoniobacterales bacterium]|nr:PA2169 family four-helix-bundle protein [Chthoniobacterales bacterium]